MEPKSAPCPVLSEYGGPEASFSASLDAGGVKIVSNKDGTFGSGVVRSTAATPTGPFTDPVKVAEHPWPKDDQTTWRSRATTCRASPTEPWC